MTWDIILLSFITVEKSNRAERAISGCVEPHDCAQRVQATVRGVCAASTQRPADECRAGSERIHLPSVAGSRHIGEELPEAARDFHERFGAQSTTAKSSGGTVRAAVVLGIAA